MLHLVHLSKGLIGVHVGRACWYLMRRIQQTTLKNIRKPIRPNSSSLYATASLEPLQTISRCARCRTRLEPLRFVRPHGALSLRSVRTVYICLLTIVFRAHCACTASKARFLGYTTLFRQTLFRQSTVGTSGSWLQLNRPAGSTDYRLERRRTKCRKSGTVQ